MKVIIAIDSFKGCLTSREANEAAVEGFRKAYPDAEIVKVPVSDGGEGYMEAFHAGCWIVVSEAIRLRKWWLTTAVMSCCLMVDGTGRCGSGKGRL